MSQSVSQSAQPEIEKVTNRDETHKKYMCFVCLKNVCIVVLLAFIIHITDIVVFISFHILVFHNLIYKQFLV